VGSARNYPPIDYQRCDLPLLLGDTYDRCPGTTAGTPLDGHGDGKSRMGIPAPVARGTSFRWWHGNRLRDHSLQSLETQSRELASYCHLAWEFYGDHMALARLCTRA